MKKKTIANGKKTAEQIFDLIGENNSITIAELAKMLNKAEITIKTNIRDLQQMNKLTREAGNKTGKWMVITSRFI
jgi:predicted HTH transcriptional regulator